MVASGPITPDVERMGITPWAKEDTERCKELEKQAIICADKPTIGCWYEEINDG